MCNWSMSARPATRPARSWTWTTGKNLFELSDRHGFVIASDECYSEIYFDEAAAAAGRAAGGRGNSGATITATW